MAPRPGVERWPDDLDEHWVGVWNLALAAMKADGIWEAELRPLLDEYVYALVAAHRCRQGFAWLDHLTECVAAEEIEWATLGAIAAGLPTQWDRHVRRAVALADQLALTPRGRKAVGLAPIESDDAADPFAALDEADELAERRRQAGA